MKTRRYAFALASMLLRSVCCGQALPRETAAILIEDSQPRCSTITMKPAAQRPGEELAAYLEKICGAKVPVVSDQAAIAGYRIIIAANKVAKLAKQARIEHNENTWQSPTA